MIPKRRVVILSIAFSAALAAAMAATTPEFHVNVASAYAHQTSEQVTIGAKPYNTPELEAEAFGKKVDLLKYGVVPVLVVIENKRQKTVDLQNLEVTLVSADGRHATSVSPDQLFALGTPHGARSGGNQVPLPIPLPKKKNPMLAPELVIRAFAAKLLAPGDAASGFFYFEAKSEPGDKLYVNGLNEMPSGHELLYFEFPLRKEALGEAGAGLE